MVYVVIETHFTEKTASHCMMFGLEDQDLRCLSEKLQAATNTCVLCEVAID